MHDLISELHGYRNELGAAERYSLTDQATAVRAEVERVTAAIRERAAAFLDRAAEHESNGQDALAIRARAEARRLIAAVDYAPSSSDAPASSNAADSTPRETATTRRKRA